MTMTATAPAQLASRDLSLDVAKGLGIILVVIGHAHAIGGPGIGPAEAQVGHQFVPGAFVGGGPIANVESSRAMRAATYSPASSMPR